jgi:predicted phosphodiesterase
MRVLCAGDFHLGRRPSRLPSSVDPRDTAATSTWIALVNYAIAQQVDLVALSGDVVDRDNRYFEALGPLEAGLRRLHGAGIKTVAVAGNHDYSVLPDLARSLPDGCFQLLGTGGQWERTTIASAANEKLYVDGWSFPAPHIRENPLADYTLPEADAHVLGLLHADLDQPASPYAPVILSDLQSRAVSMWLLGHVHVPSLRRADNRPPVLYPGSPQPLDPGERGARGAWLVDFQPGETPRPCFVPLATVRYDVLDVDASGVSDVSAARVLIIDQMRRHAEQCATGDDVLRHLSLRVRVSGQTAAHKEIAADMEFASELDLLVGDVAVYVERITCDVRAARDLDALGAGSDAIAWIARLLVAAERGESSSEHSDLRRQIEPLVGRVTTAKPYRNLSVNGGEVDAAALNEYLTDAARGLLDELLEQSKAAR